MLKLKCGVQALYFVHGFRSSLLYSTSSSSSSLANYLVESLGFSYPQSIFTSTKLSQIRQSSGIKNASDDCKLVSNANLVINFFKQTGFDQFQIRRILNTVPRILLSNVDRTLKPKIEILRELGLSASEVSNAISLNPILLHLRLIPVIESLKQVVGSDENVRRFFQSQVLRWSFLKQLISNVKLLERYGIPNNEIEKHVVREPKAFMLTTQLLKHRLTIVEQKFAIPRNSGMFLYGIRILAKQNKKAIESKFQILKSFGWVQSDIALLMSNNPNCIGFSEATLKKKLDFFMNKLECHPAFLATCDILNYSLEKKILPRHEVLQILREKGLIGKDCSLLAIARMNESWFLNKFVLPYEELHEAYAKQVGCSAKLLAQGSNA